MPERRIIDEPKQTLPFSFIEKLTPLIPADENLQWHGPASEADVSVVEERLGFRFPQDYREFLRTYGGGGLPIHEVSGIYPGQPENNFAGNVLFDTLFCRETFGLPLNYAVVHSDFLIDLFWVIDVSAASPAVENYCIFYKQIDRPALAASFPDYLREQLEMSIGQ